MKTATNRPPVYALLVDTVGWTLDRTADFPKSQRFTFGERVDRLTLDCLELVLEAIYASRENKAPLPCVVSTSTWKSFASSGA